MSSNANMAPVDLDKLDDATRAVVERFLEGPGSKRRRQVPTRVGAKEQHPTGFVDYAKKRANRMTRAEYLAKRRIDEEADKAEREAHYKKPRIIRVRVARSRWKNPCHVCGRGIYPGDEVATLLPAHKPIHTGDCAKRALAG